MKIIKQRGDFGKNPPTSADDSLSPFRRAGGRGEGCSNLNRQTKSDFLLNENGCLAINPSSSPHLLAKTKTPPNFNPIGTFYYKYSEWQT